MSVFTNPAGRSREGADAYTRALFELLGDREPVEVLAATSAAVRHVLAGVSEDALARPERDGKWSMCAILRHLADSEIVWAWRLRLVLAQDRPPISGYDQDAWAERLGYADADIVESLDEFDCLRRSNLRLLARATPADRARAGLHDERGEESVEHMMKLYAGHDLLHIRQLERVKAAVTARGPAA